MSNSDDDNSTSGASSTTGAKRRKTLLGLGLSAERMERLQRAADQLPPREPDDDFEAEATQISDPPSVDDSAVRHAVDRAWDDLFEVKTGAFAVPLLDEEEQRKQATSLHSAFDEGLDSLSLEEESLPEAIHEPTPTLEDLAPEAMPMYRGDNETLADFEAQQTEMVDTPFQTEPTVARIVCLNGPASGQEFFASAARNTVGRGTANTIVVPDVAMSRQHFEIVRNADDTFSVVDLQSINGTTLNGTRVREADLLHGDRLEAGKSQFQFVLSGTVPANPPHRRVVPAPEPTIEARQLARPPAKTANAPNKLLLPIAALTIFLTVVVLAIAVAITMREPAVPAPAVDASTMYLAGVEAVKTQDWDRAQQQFEAARHQDPNFDGVDLQLARIASERKAQAELAEARRQLKDRRVPAALETLAGIPEDSVYASEAQALARDARRGEVLSMYADAQEAFANDDLERAQLLANEIVDRVPNHLGANELLRRLAPADSPDAGVADVDVAEVVDVAEEEESPQPKRMRRRRKPKDDWGFFDIDSGNKGGTQKSVAGPAPNFTRGFHLYRTGKLADAQRFFDDEAKSTGAGAASAQSIADAMRTFQGSYKPGLADLRSARYDDAARHLKAAQEADKIVGGYYAAELRAKRADAEAGSGLACLAQNKLACARRKLRAASGLNPDGERVLELEKALKNR